MQRLTSRIFNYRGHNLPGKFSLDKLQTAIPSANASVTTEIAATSPYKNGLNLTAGSAGVNFADNGGGANQFTNGKLSNMFQIKVDGHYGGRSVCPA